MMKSLLLFVRILLLFIACVGALSIHAEPASSRPTAEFILGNPDYLAMSYSGWRKTTRTDEFCPTVADIKEDLLLMEAMGVRIIRTYNAQLFL
jgi:hypothetical protein